MWKHTFDDCLFFSSLNVKFITCFPFFFFFFFFFFSFNYLLILIMSMKSVYLRAKQVSERLKE